MNIIKVDAIGSTNTFLKDINRNSKNKTPVCVIAKTQSAGKGQRGAVWQSNPGENLTCSVFMPITQVALADQFLLSMVVALSVHDTLQSFQMPKLAIKWPNDILSDSQKICGILIENIVNSGSLQGAIIGIGINVNQTMFHGIPNAGSMKGISGMHYAIEEVLIRLLDRLENEFLSVSSANFESVKDRYEKVLFRKNKPSTFLDAEGEKIIGIIQQVTRSGTLEILLEDAICKEFDLKEIKLLY